MKKTKIYLFISMTFVLFFSCDESAFTETSDDVPDLNFLINKVSTSDFYVNLIDLNKQIKSKVKLYGSTSEFESDFSATMSKSEFLEHLSHTFHDEQIVYELLKRSKSNLNNLILAVLEIAEIGEADQILVFEQASKIVYHQKTSVISRTMGYCEDAKERGLESCAVGASIGAISCLPSLAAAGWGYLICAGAVAAGAAACEISVNSEYYECVNNQ